MSLFITKGILLTQGQSQRPQPEPVFLGLSCPDSTRVVLMGSLVGGFLSGKPYCCTEELSIFEYHFDTMSIYMPFCTLLRIKMKEEDVHFSFSKKVRLKNNLDKFFFFVFENNPKRKKKKEKQSMFVRNILFGCSIRNDDKNDAKNDTPITYLSKVRLYIWNEKNELKLYECSRPDDEKVVICPINEEITKILGRFCALDRQDIDSDFFSARTGKIETDAENDLPLCFRNMKGSLYLDNASFFFPILPTNPTNPTNVESNLNITA